MRVFDLDSGDLICDSCAIYGAQPGAAGNELGYLVEMPLVMLDDPWEVQPGQGIRITATYDASNNYFGEWGTAERIWGLPRIWGRYALRNVQGLKFLEVSRAQHS